MARLGIRTAFDFQFDHIEPPEVEVRITADYGYI